MKYAAVLFVLFAIVGCSTPVTPEKSRDVDDDAFAGAEGINSHFADFTFDQIIMRYSGERVFADGSFSRNWYSNHLRALEEPSLVAALDPEMFILRFTWLRTFHNPVAIRVEVNHKGEPMLHYKMSDGMGGYDAGKVFVDVSRRLSEEETKQILDLAAVTDICGSPSKRDISGLDGAQWVFEQRAGNNYCVAEAWTPGSGPYRELGILLLSIAGFEETSEQRIY